MTLDGQDFVLACDLLRRELEHVRLEVGDAVDRDLAVLVADRRGLLAELATTGDTTRLDHVLEYLVTAAEQMLSAVGINNGPRIDFGRHSKRYA